MTELTDEQYDLADRIELVLEAAPAAGLTPSAVARRVRTTTAQAALVLAWLTECRYAHTSGNGAWRRYHAGRTN